MRDALAQVFSVLIEAAQAYVFAEPGVIWQLQAMMAPVH